MGLWTVLISYVIKNNFFQNRYWLDKFLKIRLENLSHSYKGWDLAKLRMVSRALPPPTIVFGVISSLLLLSLTKRPHFDKSFQNLSKGTFQLQRHCLLDKGNFPVTTHTYVWRPKLSFILKTFHRLKSSMYLLHFYKITFQINYYSSLITDWHFSCCNQRIAYFLGTSVFIYVYS